MLITHLKCQHHMVTLIVLTLVTCQHHRPLYQEVVFQLSRQQEPVVENRLKRRHAGGLPHRFNLEEPVAGIPVEICP